MRKYLYYGNLDVQDKFPGSSTVLECSTFLVLPHVLEYGTVYLSMNMMRDKMGIPASSAPWAHIFILPATQEGVDTIKDCRPTMFKRGIVIITK